MFPCAAKACSKARPRAAASAFRCFWERWIRAILQCPVPVVLDRSQKGIQACRQFLFQISDVLVHEMVETGDIKRSFGDVLCKQDYWLIQSMCVAQFVKH